jgi:hypothetical protein
VWFLPIEFDCVLYFNERKKIIIKYISESIELIPDGLAVSCRCTRPAPIRIGRSVGLRKTIVVLGRCSPNDYAKYFEIDHNGHNFAAAARFN